jgi:antitoxin VapB
MARIAKVFTTGRSQAVRLPAAFRFDTKEVYVRRDEATGDVVLSRRAPDWAGFLAQVRQLAVPSDFMADRQDTLPQKRELF